MKKISVIILNYNGKNFLDECLSSVKNQKFGDFETILVDNGSTDGSAEYIKEKFPWVKMMALGNNGGFSKGNNEGIKIAEGEYIVLLNNDTAVVPEWLGALHESISKDPKIGSCASKMIAYSDRDKIDSAGDNYSLCGAPYKRGCNENKNKYSEKEMVFGACAGAAIYRKAMLDDIGLLDEDFFLGFEDSDLSFRAQLAGYKCLYVPDAVVFHKGSATIGRTSDRQVYYGQRNVEFAYIKNMPGKLMAKYFFPHLFYNLGALFFFTVKGKGFIFLKAKFSFLANSGKMAQKRRIIQGNRRVSDDYIESIMSKDCFKSRLRAKI